ncbi:muellerian-inhibiting factor [Scomber japonicus]|uniref:muellerian-inhibiting factor n=1 Tax=Scomber japonicus TaxID=13676 RepID=UPI0023066217|nr:muellerian-inhibiting factor [Scomber japonicus]
MLVFSLSFCGVLMLCWTQLCVTLQVSHGRQLIPARDPIVTGNTLQSSHSTETRDSAETKTSPASTVSHLVGQNAPCFLDDIFAVMSERLGDDGELTNGSLTLFGVCKVSDNSSGSVLLELAKKTSRNQRNGLEVLHPAGVFLVEDEETGALALTFDLPQSPLLELSPVLLLAFESPFTGGNLDKISFTSQSLQPNTQAVCISGGTQYILLTGKASEGHVHERWRISVETKSPDMKESLKELLIGGKSRSTISPTPFLLFSTERGTESRYTNALRSSKTFSFLCELKRFLGDVLPQDHPEPPALNLDSLQSLPPLTLGLASSVNLLGGLINSSASTIFYFTSSMSHMHHGELALPLALSEELRWRLEKIVMQIMEVIREEDRGLRVMKRLERLKELSAFPKVEVAAGESQYRAFLLLKALQTVGHTYEIRRRLRATRADPDSPERGSNCGLIDLNVSLEKHLVGPNTANINNCHGPCNFPLNNTNNHAILLQSHIESGNFQERRPCCVPVAYDPLCVVNLNEHGTYISLRPDIVAKECECR